jgi:hypothetical protein
VEDHRRTGFRICVAEPPTPSWTVWFDGALVIPDPVDGTVLELDAPDQAALHGLLARVRDLGLSLRSVTPIDGPRAPVANGPTTTPDPR